MINDSGWVWCCFRPQSESVNLQIASLSITRSISTSISIFWWINDVYCLRWHLDKVNADAFRFFCHLYAMDRSECFVLDIFWGNSCRCLGLALTDNWAGYILDGLALAAENAWLNMCLVHIRVYLNTMVIKYNNKVLSTHSTGFTLV